MSRKHAIKKSVRITVKKLARLGSGEVAYIKKTTAAATAKMYPLIEGLPATGDLFTLYAANGRPLAITNSQRAASRHARNDELEVQSVH